MTGVSIANDEACDIRIYTYIYIYSTVVYQETAATGTGYSARVSEGGTNIIHVVVYGIVLARSMAEASILVVSWTLFGASLGGQNMAES